MQMQLEVGDAQQRTYSGKNYFLVPQSSLVKKKKHYKPVLRSLHFGELLFSWSGVLQM